jgi:glycosyltransferase involved in cell wall biosynthesis
MAGQPAVMSALSPEADPPEQPALLPTVALVAWGDRFEDFYGRLGITLDDFRERLVGDWRFNYVEALRSVGVRTVLFFTSAHVQEPIRFRHRPTGATVCVLPSPRLHQKARGLQDRFWPRWTAMLTVSSYLSTPLQALVRELRREQCDVILCQEYDYPRFDVCVPLGRLLRLPVFATFQGAARAVGPAEYALRRLALHTCAGLIIGARSEHERVRARYRVPPAKLAQIPNPVDVVAWQAMDRGQARAGLGIPAKTRVVGWHGRVELLRKGLDVLLEAWKRICDARPGAPLLLLLVGTGRDASELRSRLAAFPYDNIRWVDRYVHDRDLLVKHLSAVDVYAFPSRHEGFAVATLEAMACGLPVVAADAPGVSDLLEEGERSGGIVIPRGDTDALAGALGGLLDDAQQSRLLGARARRHVEQRFSLERIGTELRDFMVGPASCGRRLEDGFTPSL